MVITRYYYLFLLFPLFIKCYSYIHLIERTSSSFEENPLYPKSCKNCKYFIENDNNHEFSRCSKFVKHKNRPRFGQKQFYKEPLVQYIRNNNNDEEFRSLVLFYLATTCRNNETMCGPNAKYYQRKFFDIY
jgi:hypothetical protein